MTHPSLAAAVDQVSPTIIAVADQLWNFAEIAYTEVRSSALLKQVLQAHGFTLTHATVGELDTAFVAEYGTGAPIIGILAEYDALPGLGNTTDPVPTPRPDGQTNGHGCGHNLIGAGALGAALALRAVLHAEQLPGTLRLYGTPAEEGGIGKVLMAQTGVFHDLDACLHWHPAHLTGTFTLKTTANAKLKIEFHGKTAHAGMSPWLGRSALHAAELFAHGVNLMREHLEPTARVHYIYTRAGEAANIVAEYAALQLAVRDATVAQVQQATTWIEQIAAGAALATQTRSTTTVQAQVHDLLSNTPLAERAYAHLQQLMPISYTDAELDFAHAIQQALHVPQQGMNTKVLFPQEISIGGSTDVGDVSKITPTMGIAVQSLPLGVSLHTWAATACHGTSIGHKAAITAAHALALLGYDLFTDAGLRAAARADFEQRMQGSRYEISPPLPLPVAASIADDTDALGKTFSETVEQPAIV